MKSIIVCCVAAILLTCAACSGTAPEAVDLTGTYDGTYNSMYQIFISGKLSSTQISKEQVTVTFEGQRYNIKPLHPLMYRGESGSFQVRGNSMIGHGDFGIFTTDKIPIGFGGDATYTFSGDTLNIIYPERLYSTPNSFHEDRTNISFNLVKRK